MNDRYLVTFRHNGKLRTLGPHESIEAAKEAFQFRYGYWPDCYSVEPYAPDRDRR